MPVYKYQIFDLLDVEYCYDDDGVLIFFNIEQVTKMLFEFQKSYNSYERFEIHKIKIGEMQTLE